MIKVWKILSSVEGTCPLLLGNWSLTVRLVPATMTSRLEKYFEKGWRQTL